MASIDKTYTNSYSEYKEFKDWAKNQIVEFFDGHKEYVSKYIWNREESDFNGQEIAIMNSPTWLDIYLIQNCECTFVLNRMRTVHGQFFDELQNIDLKAKPLKDFQQNRKIVITRTKYTKYPLHSKPYGGKCSWWLQTEDFWYNSYTKTWVANGFYYPYNTNTAIIKSIKGVVRHLRKQYLPEGAKFRITGLYFGEEYLITIR